MVNNTIAFRDMSLRHMLAQTASMFDRLCVPLPPTTAITDEDVKRIARISLQRCLAWLDGDFEACDKLHAEGEVAILSLIARVVEVQRKAQF